MKFKQLLIALAAVSALAHAADTPGSNPSVRTPTVSERLATARAAIQAKDWTKALNELNTAAREDSRNADVQNLLGYSYRKRATPDLAKAFEHYGNALRLDPKHKGALEYSGIAYLKTNQKAQADAQLAKLQAICANCEETRDLAKAVAEYKPAAK